MIRQRPPTARQVEVCEAIAALSSKRPPTVRELAHTLGIVSTNGVHCHLTSLRAKGLVEPATGDASTRDIILTPKGWELAGGSPRMSESEAAAWIFDNIEAVLDAAANETALRDAMHSRSRVEEELRVARNERDQAQAIVALLADALPTWGQEEDGVPKDGPVAEAYDTALSMLAVWRKS